MVIKVKFTYHHAVRRTGVTHMNNNIAVITGQDRFNPNRLSTLYRGCRYDMDTHHGTVWGYTVNSMGSRVVPCSEEVTTAVKLAVASR